ncbi:MAG: GIY-YIG nuclease family protein [Flavobacteriaceae bacterium]
MPKSNSSEPLPFFYQIKGKNDEFGSWHFPPLYTGRVFAHSKKEAVAKIEDEYNQKLPLKVLNKDRDKHAFLLRVYEIKDDDTKTKSLFENNTCEICGTTFKVIEHYNDHTLAYKGKRFCSDECNHEDRVRNRAFSPTSNVDIRRQPAVIYKITNTQTKMSYVGKTTQCFTLRWYQHFYHGGDCKFHRAIKGSKHTDWQFNILETIEHDSNGKLDHDLVLERESYWIEHLDTIENGYNTLLSKISLDGTKEFVEDKL